MRWIYLLLALALAGCAPLAGAAGWSGLVGFGALVAVALWLTDSRTAQADPGSTLAEPASASTSVETGATAPPPKCDGWEHKSCQNGRVHASCCPKNAKCNYRYAPFTECGHDSCVEGKDPGMCPPRQPVVTGAKTEAECNSAWVKACVNKKVTMACLMSVPTNYMGPPRNPQFKECGNERCTTSAFVEDCYPTKDESQVCLTGWTDVCLMGKITPRCVAVTGPKSAASTGFVRCKDKPGTCVIGDDAAACNLR